MDTGAGRRQSFPPSPPLMRRREIMDQDRDGMMRRREVKSTPWLRETMRTLYDACTEEAFRRGMFDNIPVASFRVPDFLYNSLRNRYPCKSVSDLVWYDIGMACQRHTVPGEQTELFVSFVNNELSSIAFLFFLLGRALVYARIRPGNDSFSSVPTSVPSPMSMKKRINICGVEFERGFRLPSKVYLPDAVKAVSPVLHKLLSHCLLEASKFSRVCREELVCYEDDSVDTHQFFLVFLSFVLPSASISRQEAQMTLKHGLQVLEWTLGEDEADGWEIALVEYEEEDVEEVENNGFGDADEEVDVNEYEEEEGIDEYEEEEELDEDDRELDEEISPEELSAIIEREGLHLGEE